MKINDPRNKTATNLALPAGPRHCGDRLAADVDFGRIFGDSQGVAKLAGPAMRENECED